ncbi:MAG TPA: ABC transporter substrate-binding protein [Stellaceae bacterium]|nr:ABC transporter substrate-binding protein [Stellaceae bacterium]
MRKMEIIAPALAGAALAGLAAAPASAQTVKIGVIGTFSGPTEQQGEMLERGLQLYYKTHQNDLPKGVKIQLIERDDTGANPEVAKRLAQELVTRDHVQLLTGFVWSPNFMSVAPVATQGKIPAISLNAAATKAVQMSPYMVRVSFTLPQQAYPLGTWAAKKGYKRAYTAVSDYAPGHEAEEAFSKAFKAAGGQVIGQLVFPAPPTTPDFAPFLQKIKDAKPDLVYIFVPAGGQATAVMKTSVDLDYKGSNIALISTQDLVPDEEIANMGDAIIGLITAGTYTSDSPRPANKAFVAAWDKEYPGSKLRPDFESADAYSGMKMIFEFVSKTHGKFTGDEAMDFFKHWKDPDSPRGPIMVDPNTRDILQNVYMRRMEKQNGKAVDVEFETIGMVNSLGQVVSSK